MNIGENLKDGFQTWRGAAIAAIAEWLTGGPGRARYGFARGLRFVIAEFSESRKVTIGYDPHSVLTATVRLPIAGYAASTDRARLMQRAMERMRSMPGVESVGIADCSPMQGAESASLKIVTPTSTHVDDIYLCLSVLNILRR